MRQGGFVLLLTLVFLAGFARAHLVAPVIADLTLAQDGRAILELQTDLEALIAGTSPGNNDTNDAPEAADYETLRALPPADLIPQFDPIEAAVLEGLTLSGNGRAVVLTRAGIDIPDVPDLSLPRISTLRYSGQWPVGIEQLDWQHPEILGDLVLRVRMSEGDRLVFAALLAPGDDVKLPLDGSALQPGFWQTLAYYIDQGFDHILPKGIDHVLFIVGLFLLSAQLRPLLVQVTAFTLAHSVTLALGLAGWINLPDIIVEPLIALSIVFVAVENMFTRTLHRWRTAIVFGFGLLHGLGFAGALSELGTGTGQFAASLLGFNIGVELGQIAVVVLCYATVGYWFGTRPWYRRVIVIPASVVIALIAGWWFFERIGLIG